MSISGGGEGGGGVGGDNQFPTVDPESKCAKITKFHFGEGGLVTTIFQLLIMSPNVLKSQSPIPGGRGAGVGANKLSKVNFKLSSLSPKLKFPFLGEGGVSDNLFPTFDPGSKSTKIPKSHLRGEGR